MNLLTELIVPLVSVVGTSTAVLIAVDQITAGSRLRRQAIFWRDMAAQEHALSRDSDVSHSLQREALGKLVALSALPAKWLLVPALLVFSAVAAAVMLGVRIGEIPPAELTWTKLLEKEEQDPGTLVLIVLPSVASLGTAAFLNPLLLRKKVARAYLDGDPLELDSINAGRSLKDNLGGLGLVLIFAFGFGLTGMAAAIGGFAGAGPNPASISEWVVLVLFLGAALASTSGLALYAKVQDYAKEEWHHPRALPVEAPHQSRWQSLRAFFRRTRRAD
ncbi:hypothetical protein ACX800_22880 [Paenarthrobacter nitroguajacolicus]|uniref:hypothetical protein n=1 Tax=Micrococcaceae TaxID=1268 RepID=UPI001E3A989D|nr:hypothetical protein [Arthrobacter sp. AK01]MCD4850765.1 hypothetical protein [Arthrobacter sp. AK01]